MNQITATDLDVMATKGLDYMDAEDVSIYLEHKRKFVKPESLSEIMESAGLDPTNPEDLEIFQKRRVL